MVSPRCPPQNKLDPSDLLLPDPKSWPHRPIFFQAASGTHVDGYGAGAALPVGIPVAFSSPLFQGKVLLRLRHAPSDHPADHNSYFSGRKRYHQFVVQGRFQRPLPMSQVYFGNVYQKKLAHLPPKMILKLIQAVFARLAPGMTMDLTADVRPSVIGLWAGMAKTFRMDRPGEEPDITAMEIIEDATLVDSQITTTQQRHAVLTKVHRAAQYHYSTDHVYTFEIYDDMFDLGTHYLRIPFLGHFDIAQTLNGQPMSMSARTADGQVLFDFPLWHERTIQSSKRIATAAAAVANSSNSNSNNGNKQENKQQKPSSSSSSSTTSSLSSNNTAVHRAWSGTITTLGSSKVPILVEPTKIAT